MIKITINRINCVVHETNQGKWLVAEDCTRELITNIPCESKLQAIRRANSIINLINLKKYHDRNTQQQG